MNTSPQFDLANFAAICPLRGGSKGIPKKNIRNFNQKPLFWWVSTAIHKSNIKLYISTEDEEITSSVHKYTPYAEIIKRPNELATDTASTESVIAHALPYIQQEHIILIQATSPLTNECHISEAIDLYFSNKCRPLITGTRSHHFIWSDDGMSINYNPQKRPRRQDWNGTFIENGAFYIFQKSNFLEYGTRCNPPCTLFTMGSDHSIEIDTEQDWSNLELLVAQSYV